MSVLRGFLDNYKNNLLWSAFIIPCISATLSTASVSALTYGSSFGLKYDVNSTLDVSLSTNTGFIISDLSAGNSAYSNTVTITIDSNASDGYTLSATVGKTSDNNRNNNRLVHSNNTNYFEGIATDANVTLANLGPNKWGYATYDTTNEIWSNYNGLATVGNAGTTLITSTTPGTKSIDMRIGASANSNQVSGTFTNDINFAATARVVTYDYSITYTANNSSTVTNMPTNITSASFNTGDNVQLSSTTPSATNAISFLGWCDGTVSGTTCTGTLYQPGDYLKFNNASSSTTNAVTLLGVWNINTITTAVYLQDVSDCGSSVAIGTTATLKDSRDEQSYTVAKLSDGKCWMTKNLNLAGNTVIEYTKSDISQSYVLDTAQGFQPGNRLPESSVSSFSDSNNNTAFLYNSNSTTCGENSPCYSYYSWITATVGGKDLNGNLITTDNTDAPYSICPKGWKLPSTRTGTDSSSDYRNLANIIGGSASTQIYNNSTSPTGSVMYSSLASSPNNFILSGFISNGSFTIGEPSGVFWSSTSHSAGGARDLFFNQTYVDFANYNYRGRGRAIRCVFAS